MICLKCKEPLRVPSDILNTKILCPTCGASFLLVQGIPIVITEEGDFFRLLHKFSRYVAKFDAANQD